MGRRSVLAAALLAAPRPSPSRVRVRRSPSPSPSPIVAPSPATAESQRRSSRSVGDLLAGAVILAVLLGLGGLTGLYLTRERT